MMRSKILTITFTFWVLIIVLSVSWLIFLFVNNFQLAFSNMLILFVLIIACFSFILSIFFMSQMLIDVRSEIKKAKEKEKNIRDFYQYDQLLDPPSIYT